MTEDTGFSPLTPDQPAPEPPAPDATLPAEPGPAPEAPAEPEPEPEAPAPEPEAAPFIPDTGVADWLREAFASVHRRLSNLGG